jgi:hypothetical protein
VTKPDFDPIVTGRFHFKFHGREVAIVSLQMMPGTSAITCVMEPCRCGAEDCCGYNQLPVNPMTALQMVGKAITELLDERDALAEQTKPGAN